MLDLGFALASLLGDLTELHLHALVLCVFDVLDLGLLGCEFADISVVLVFAHDFHVLHHLTLVSLAEGPTHRDLV